MTSLIKNIKNFFQGNNRTVAVKKNVVNSLLIKGISIVISLLIVPMTLGFVSKELYGIWLTLSSIMLWLNFFDVGFTLGLKNKLTEAIAKDEWEKGKSLVSTTYFMMVIIFIPISVILMLAVPHIDWASFLNVDAVYNPEIKLALYVLALSFCLQMIVNVLSSVVAAFQQIFLSSLFMVIGNFISLVIIYFLPKFCETSLFALACAISIAPVLVTFTASFVLFSGKYQKVSPDIKHIDLSFVKEIFSLGLKFFIIQIQVIILFQMTNVLISKLSGPNMVTEYNIAYKYISVALMVFNIILAPLWPAFTDAYTRKDYTWMNSIYSKMRKVWLLSFVGIVLMVAVSSFVYNIWVGEEVQIPFLMTFLVAVYVTLNSWDALQVMLINGIGAIKLQTYVTLAGMLVHIPLSYSIGKCLDLGGYGVVISMICVMILYSTFFTIQINKLLANKANGIWCR